MKRFTLLASALVLGATLNASPLLTIGDEVDVFLLGSVKGEWNSNIYSSNIKTDDYILTFKAGAEATYGRESNFKANVKFYELFRRYLSNAKNNNNLANVFANASYTEERWNVGVDFSYQQISTSSDDLIAPGFIGTIEGIVDYDLYKAGINGSYDITDKISATLAFRWESYEYRNYREQYSDRDTYIVPATVFYKVSEKIQAGLTYRFSYTDYEGGNAASAATYGNRTVDHYAGVTIRGELAPKLSTELFFGYMFRDIGGLENDSDFSLSARFDYVATEKLRTYIKGFRDFGNGASRQSSTNTGVELGANYTFSDKISAYVSARYYNAAYMRSSRDDDNLLFAIGATWKPFTNTYLTASYRYLDNMSDAGAGSSIDRTSYMGHLVSIEAGFKY